MKQAANLRWALAAATLLAAGGWTQAVHAESVVVTLNGVETIGVSDTGRPRPSALINGLETIGVVDAGGPFASAFLRANEAVAVADVGPLSVTVGPNGQPTAIPGGPYTVELGGTVQLRGSGNDPDGDALTFAWDLDNNGVFETPGQNVDIQPTGGVGDLVVGLQVCDPAPLCGTASTVVHVVSTDTGPPGPGGPPGVGATPELDSLILFGTGLSGLAGYSMLRLRARRRR
jgi:hypothetical protein